MQDCNFVEARDLDDARWRIKERDIMKRHLRERIQLLSRQRDKKLKLITAKRNVPSLCDDEVEAIENQLTIQMNLESRQEVNCSLIGPQNKEDRKELKRKLWTNPKEMAKTQDGTQAAEQQENTPSLQPELVSGDGEQPELQGQRRLPPTRDPQPPGEDAMAGHDPIRPLHPGAGVEIKKPVPTGSQGT